MPKKTGASLLNAFIAVVNADHTDVIPVGREDGCLMRDEIERLRKVEQGMLATLWPANYSFYDMKGKRVELTSERVTFQCLVPHCEFTCSFNPWGNDTYQEARAALRNHYEAVHQVQK